MKLPTETLDTEMEILNGSEQNLFSSIERASRDLTNHFVLQVSAAILFVIEGEIRAAGERLYIFTDVRHRKAFRRIIPTTILEER